MAEHRDVISIHLRVRGPAHPESLGARKGCTSALHEAGERDVAEGELREALKIAWETFGEHKPGFVDMIAKCQRLTRGRGSRVPDNSGGVMSVVNHVEAGYGPVVQAGAVHGGVHFHSHGAHSASRGTPPVPRSLPRDLADFTGRDHELRQLLAAVERAAGDEATAVAIHAIDGMPGVGKTTLGVHAAHTLAPKYPDGTLFLNLWGHTPGQRPRDPFDALHALMADLGVPSDVLARHSTLDDRMRLWRSVVAGRRLLVLLDDAADHHQVTPLLPGTRGSLVLITSRNRFPELDGVHPLTLDVLPTAEATRMLLRLAGRAPEPAEAEQVTRLVELCGRLPLAIAITASHLRTHPTWPVGHLADTVAAQLVRDADRLDEFGHGARSVEAAFDTSFRDLPDDLRSMFTLLGAHHGPEIDAHAAAALAAITPRLARRALEGLHLRHLVQETSPGRYRLHDLIRAYAHSRAGRLSPERRREAITRALDHYVHTAHTATRLLPARRARSAPAILAAPAHPVAITSTSHAFDWLTTELPTLVTAVGHTHTTHPAHTLGLSTVLYPYFRAVGHWQHARAMLHTALTTAIRTGDVRAEAAVSSDLAYVYRRQGDLDTALAILIRTFELHTRISDALGQAATLTDLGYVHLLRGESGEAVDASRRAVDLYARGDDLMAWVNALNYLGYVHLLRGQADQAVQTQQRALDLHIRRGDPLGQANAHLGVGIAHHQRHEPGPARDNLTRALHLFTLGEDVDAQAETHNALGDLALDHPETGSAHHHYTTALGLARACGTKRHQADALVGEARCLHHAGDTVQAVARLREALATHRAMNASQVERITRLIATFETECGTAGRGPAVDGGSRPGTA